MSEKTIVGSPAVQAPVSGYLVRCTECGREERTGQNPLKNGWPKCCGYTMRLEDNERFVADIDRAMGEIFAPVHAALDTADPSGSVLSSSAEASDG